MTVFFPRTGLRGEQHVRRMHIYHCCLKKESTHVCHPNPGFFGWKGKTRYLIQLVLTSGTSSYFCPTIATARSQSVAIYIFFSCSPDPLLYFIKQWVCNGSSLQQLLTRWPSSILPSSNNLLLTLWLTPHLWSPNWNYNSLQWPKAGWT